jgi:uncharacterized protein (TIGR03118 family)
MARRLMAAAFTTVLASGFTAAQARDDGKTYRAVNLVSDQAGVAALQDTNLVNAWGIATSSSSPFWVSANGTGLALLYSVTNDATGAPQVSKVGLQVQIPGEGSVTGQAFNNSSGFNGDAFLFVSEDGTISGWRPALGTTAETFLTRTGAVYKGVTLVSSSSGPRLLAANFSEGTVDAYNTNLTLVQFSDPHAPAGYAPFNVQQVAGAIFVTFAKQDPDKKDDVPGPGHGFIDILNLATGKFNRFATGSDTGGKLRELNSPWGLALSPRSFGEHRDQLLVGNFGSGTIMSFEADGKFRGLLRGEHEKTLVIDGLWALRVGNGGRGGVTNTVYFSAGPSGENHGLFGSIDPVEKHHHGNGHDGDGDDDHDDD